MPFNVAELRRRTAEGHWQTDAGSAASDGNYCAYLAPNEEVVCVECRWQPCNHNNPIDGNKRIIKDVTQQIFCRHPRPNVPQGTWAPFGAEGCDCFNCKRGINEGGDRSVKLVNAPFPRLTQQDAPCIWAQT